jgi:hypothetical protein
MMDVGMGRKEFSGGRGGRPGPEGRRPQRRILPRNSRPSVLPIMKATVAAMVLGVFAASALVIPGTSGTWPANWPKELEPLRERSRTTEWATGSQEDSHAIPFADRADFEKHWPVFRKLLKPGARVTLRSPQESGSPVEDLTKPSVIVHAPPAGVALDGEKTFRTGFTWPESAYLPDRTLPEYVVSEEKEGKKRWVPLVAGSARKGFHYRARIDLSLVVDGSVIDLNRIRFPEGVTVVDARKGLAE